MWIERQKKKKEKKRSHQSFKRNWHYIQVFQPLMYPFLNNFLLLHLVLGFHSNQQYLLHFLGFVLIWFDQNNHKICGNNIGQVIT